MRFVLQGDMVTEIDLDQRFNTATISITPLLPDGLAFFGRRGDIFHVELVKPWGALFDDRHRSARF